MYSMSALSDRRLAILSFIRTRVVVEGQPPTLAEIADACGLASRGAARKHVLALQKAGLIDVAPGKARGATPKGARARSELLGSSLFEITPQDIGALDDSDLRELVARLHIASLSVQGHPARHVTWGGDQRARDGGIDVRVDVETAVAASVKFLRGTMGIQVKAMSMPKAKIQDEMCPNGMLRPAIRALIRSEGAYIIVSSESTSDQMYQERVAAMRQAAASEPGASAAAFDFYDARRMADWTNQHPGVVAWVRERLGTPLQGWRPYGQWVVSAGGESHPFIGDDIPRLVDSSDPERVFSLMEGLQHMRALLRQGGNSIRIAGLSGVGKTRFVQALFEEEAAENPLDPTLAVYTDISDSPLPVPQTLVDELVANRRRAVLIVDNCSSELHTQLTAKCKVSGIVSLLTIEYDIREDIPDETNVFRLEPASPDLIAKVIEQQFPHISQVDRSTITRFADGNSRVAIALAGTLGKRDSLAGITNYDLFRRLFWQKQDQTDSLLRAAQACALVYSFDGENQNNELPRLAALAGMEVLELYREVSILIKRGLAQKRGVWRAVLPHAIANVLAAQALSAIPYGFIEQQLVAGEGRLLRSFSRRLGYLHDNAEARTIVQAWLSADGLLGEVFGLSELLSEVLRNIAPVDPEATLRAIERAAEGSKSEQFFSTENGARGAIKRLLRSIAWDKQLFDRCIRVLVGFALAESPAYKSDRAAEIIKSMFPLYLSGTHATKEQRAAWVRAGLASNDERLQRLASECLDAALKANHFTSHYGFDFGARSRDFGYAPKRGAESREWFKPFVALAVEFGAQHSSVGVLVRNVLSSRFCSLWSVVGLYDELETAVATLTPVGWEKGWLAIRKALKYDRKGMPEEALQRLTALERSVRPTTLVDRTKAIVLTSYASGLDVTDGDEEDGLRPYERAELQAEELGGLVAADSAALATLLPLLVENRQGRQLRFGFGLAKGAADPAGMWRTLVGAFASASLAARSVQVLNGFLGGLHLRDKPMFERVLDEALDDPTLSEWLPLLQTSVKLDRRGCERLKQSLARGRAAIELFQYLAYGNVTSELADADLAPLLQAIAGQEGGLLVALEILAMYRYGEKTPFGSELVSLARELLPRVPLPKEHQQLDFSLTLLVKKCLVGPDAEVAARALLRHVRAGLDEYSLSSYDFDDMIAALFAVQPLAALDELVGDVSDKDLQSIRLRYSDSEHRQSPLSQVPIDTLIVWCRAGGRNRWASLAASIPPFVQREDGSEEWSQAALELAATAPEPLKVVRVLAGRLAPMSWSGSRSAIMAARLPLIDALEAFLGDEGVAELTQWREQFKQQMDRERSWESAEQRGRNERFE